MQKKGELSLKIILAILAALLLAIGIFLMFKRTVIEGVFKGLL